MLETALRVLAGLTVMLIIMLVMGKRQLGELSPFDFIISITSGTIVGAAIVDPRLNVQEALFALFCMGVLQVLFSWLTLKSRFFHKLMNFQPTVLVEDGQPIRGNLAKARLTIETLLQLLREKGVFNIADVEVAVLEPHGKLSVLKKTVVATPTSLQMQCQASTNRTMLPVIMDGELQTVLLAANGFTSADIAALRTQINVRMDQILLAYLDANHNLHVVKNDVVSTRHLFP